MRGSLVFDGRRSSRYVASLSEGPRRDLEQRLSRRLLGEGGDRPIALNARAWAVAGVVPGR